MPRISPNFTLEELTRTSTGIANKPSAAAIANLQYLVHCVLQPLRSCYGAPIRVNSGYRSKAVNTAVGGATNSQHMQGRAADITAGTPSKNKQLFDLIRSLDLPFDQLIDEHDYQWLHVSYCDTGNRHQVLHIGK